MLEALQERALCVCELTALVKAGQSTVSKHLAMLKLYAKWDEMEAASGYSLWTDDYANLLQIYMW